MNSKSPVWQTYDWGIMDLGGQDRVAVECPHPNQEDVGSNLTATRKRIIVIGRPPELDL